VDPSRPVRVKEYLNVGAANMPPPFSSGLTQDFEQIMG